MSLQEDGTPMKAPRFPDIEVCVAVNQKTGGKAVVMSFLNDGEQIDAILCSKQAIEVAKAMMMAAIASMDEDEIAELEDINVIKMDGFTSISGVA